MKKFGGIKASEIFESPVIADMAQTAVKFAHLSSIRRAVLFSVFLLTAVVMCSTAQIKRYYCSGL